MIDIGADKTRLQVYAKKGFMVDKDVETPIFINEQNIPFTDLAEYVGVIRSTSGNGPALLARISAHRKALAMSSIQELLGLIAVILHQVLKKRNYMQLLYYYQESLL